MRQVIIIFLFTLISPIICFSQDSLLIEALKANTHQINLKDGQLSGKGLELFDEAAQNAPFFLIGESHGMAEIPKFTAALFNSLQNHGYRYYATETGPYTAQFLQETMMQADFMSQAASFLQTYPWSLPFFSWQEEWEVLEAAMDGKSPKENIIWGLDQEFAASFRMNFKHLMDNAKTDESRQVAEEYYDLTMSLYNEFVSTRNPGKSFMAAARPSDFEKLRTAFTGQANSLDRIRELEESIHIYQLWSSREGYKSNCLRAEMMKHHFWDYYSKAKEQDPNPKVLFKFGSNHMYRGANSLNVFDIGNFVSEIASQMDTESFHLYILGRKGTQNTFSPFSQSEDDKHTKYDALEAYDKIDVSTILQATSEEEWSVVDLRPLRKALFNHSLQVDDSGMEKIIWSYDAILVIPEVSASTMIKNNASK